MKKAMITYLVVFHDENDKQHHEKVQTDTPYQAIDLVNNNKSEMRDIKCYTIQPVSINPEEV